MTLGHDARLPVDGSSYVRTTPSSWPTTNTSFEDLISSSE